MNDKEINNVSNEKVKTRDKYYKNSVNKQIISLIGLNRQRKKHDKK